MTDTPDDPPAPPPLPLYYEGLDLAAMEARLRAGYLTTSGWLESADAKLALRDGAPVPWFTYAAIAFLEAEVAPDTRIFEYGGGQSTLYWAARAGRVTSIDHDPAFEAHLRPHLPANAALEIIPEGAPLPSVLPGALAEAAAAAPDLPDPERTTRTYRSGQLNTAFRAYALDILRRPQDSFDMVIVDGMARDLSAWAAIRSFRRGGFIVFDNSDRDEYARAYGYLEAAGYRRIDFWGLGPINPYEWCTSVFYQPTRFAGTRWLRRPIPAPEPAPDPATKPAPAPDPAPATPQGAGILVLGYNRPHHLQSVLESLRHQGALARTHVWLDGTQKRGEYLGAADRSRAIAEAYPVAELRAQGGHLGVEKMMLDALAQMSARYASVIVLEDDCFPPSDGIALFEAALEEVRDRPEVFSVYGHPFGTEPEESRDFTRFQGWGWAAWSDRIRALLPELQRLFGLPEAEYLAEIAARMTPQIAARLDRTPGRNVRDVLKMFFSWDSAIAFLTAEAEMLHRRTARPASLNTGIVPGIGHFRDDGPRLRGAPFNMIALEEAWDHWDRATSPPDPGRESFGLEGLDLKIRAALPDAPGFLIEIGAHDGVTQSNSVILERAGWRGLLVEALPAQYAAARAARPGMIVEHAACVADPPESGWVTMTDVGLMSLGPASALDGAQREGWLARGEGFAKRPRQEVEVPAATLSGLLDKHACPRPDLLLLDVEGAETDVLGGLDFTRHAPRFIVAEDAGDDTVARFLAQRGYRLEAILSERRFTRDCLYVLA